MRVLFVCHGNICRSPMAEGMLRSACAEYGLDWEVDSAGLSGEHNGEDMHPNTKKILTQHGAYFKHSARQIASSDSEFDLILAATQYQAGLLQKRFPQTRVQTMLPDSDVPDPWYGSYADYQAVYAMLAPMVLELVHGSKA